MNDQEINLEQLTEDVNLAELTDQQKMWMTQLSYLTISEEGRQKAREGGLTVEELKDYLADPDMPYFGTAGVGNKTFDKAVGATVGDHTPVTMTNAELLQAICDSGLGGLKITDVSDEKTLASSGFQALAFEDTHGNKGVSFRGSDIDLNRGMIDDWWKADFVEFFKDGSQQAVEAKQFFEKNQDPNGNNYIYGHSLGGNLAQHVFVDNHENIAQACVINANPINQRLIDTPEKVAAFNDPEKHQFYAVCGDIVSQFKDCGVYENNINYIRNEGKLTGLMSHFVQAAQFNEDGSFVKTDKTEMQQELGKNADFVLGKVRDLRERLNVCEQYANQFKDKIGNAFNEFKNDIADRAKTFAENVEIGRKLHLDKAIEITKDIDLDTLGKAVEGIQTGDVTKVVHAVEEIDLEELGKDVGAWFGEFAKDVGISSEVIDLEALGGQIGGIANEGIGVVEGIEETLGIDDKEEEFSIGNR